MPLTSESHDYLNFLNSADQGRSSLPLKGKVNCESLVLLLCLIPGWIHSVTGRVAGVAGEEGSPESMHRTGSCWRTQRTWERWSAERYVRREDRGRKSTVKQAALIILPMEYYACLLCPSNRQTSVYQLSLLQHNSQWFHDEFPK